MGQPPQPQARACVAPKVVIASASAAAQEVFINVFISSLSHFFHLFGHFLFIFHSTGSFLPHIQYGMLFRILH
jgi:hypothetical protein